ncbi:MAG: type II toxin-antitoxin system VapC family toxin [Spirochaetaceae bacterium]|nr:type II toxin-antitoxin system VapC family toxin [Spirochaetaceae bacterium]MCF7948143.1 type II toxin-antitoxin system VapC family toxin [Spirochaetia bacterium]MCF7950791.1 type II toxin-antitoxin system VapC family toxin [Spirochaetaceae bacterium]
MVIDTSAVLAVLQNEPERDTFLRFIVDAPIRRMSATSYVEAGIVLESRSGTAGTHQLILFMSRAEIQVEQVDLEQAEIALYAFRRFGKGRHAAGLNYGDCFSYALASVKEEPLLYKGSDFPETDIQSVE